MADHSNEDVGIMHIYNMEDNGFYVISKANLDLLGDDPSIEDEMVGALMEGHTPIEGFDLTEMSEYIRTNNLTVVDHIHILSY